MTLFIAVILCCILTPVRTKAAIASLFDEADPLVKLILEQNRGEGISTFSKEIEGFADDFSRLAIENKRPLPITNIVDQGSKIEVSRGVHAKIKFLTLSSMCSDWHCLYPVATDIYGAIQVDYGLYRGFTRLLFLIPASNSTNATELAPALTLFEYGLEDIEVRGCELAEPPVTGDGYLLVQNCADGKINSLKVYHNTTKSLLARPLTREEEIPLDTGRYPGDPGGLSADFDGPIALQFENFSVPDFVITETGNICFQVIIVGEICLPFTLGVDVTGTLQNAVGSLVTSLIDLLGNMFLPLDFGPDAPASQATLADIFRILQTYAAFRLDGMTIKLSERGTTTLVSNADSVVASLVGEKPTVSTLPDVLSGSLLIIIASGALGWYLGSANRRALYASAALAAAAFATEMTAFVLRWMDFQDLDEWKKHVLVIWKAEVSRAGNFLPLATSNDGNLMTFTIMVVELTDAGTDYLGVFITATVTMVLTFAISFALGCRNRMAGVDNAAPREEGETTGRW